MTLLLLACKGLGGALPFAIPSITPPPNVVIYTGFQHKYSFHINFNSWESYKHASWNGVEDLRAEHSAALPYTEKLLAGPELQCTQGSFLIEII